MNKASTHYMRGIAHWAKVLGSPRKNNFDDGKEWSIDVTPDKDGMKLFKQLGIADRLREPKTTDPREERYMTFRQRELKFDGTKAEPITVYDAAGNPWNPNTLIGNGSVVDVKFSVKDYGPGKKKGVYIKAIRVMDLVPFQSADFAPVSEDDEYFANASNCPTFEKDFGIEPEDDLDDDVPID